jgi:hypothetical protein
MSVAGLIAIAAGMRFSGLSWYRYRYSNSRAGKQFQATESIGKNNEYYNNRCNPCVASAIYGFVIA